MLDLSDIDLSQEGLDKLAMAFGPLMQSCTEQILVNFKSLSEDLKEGGFFDTTQNSPD
jgi:hypothetical protein